MKERQGPYLFLSGGGSASILYVHSADAARAGRRGARIGNFWKWPIKEHGYAALEYLDAKGKWREKRYPMKESDDLDKVALRAAKFAEKQYRKWTDAAIARGEKVEKLDAEQATMKNPKRKFSPAQIAAQKRFAAMAKAGKFRKRRKLPAKRGKAVSKSLLDKYKARLTQREKAMIARTLKRGKAVRNPKGDKFRASVTFISVRGEEPIIFEKTFRSASDAAEYAQSRLSDAAHFHEKAHRDGASELQLSYRARDMAKLRGYERRSFQPRNRAVTVTIERVAPAVKRNPVRAGARRKPPTRFKRSFGKYSGKYVIRASRPVKSGYLYYYLWGDEFVKDAKHADKFSKAAGELKMRAILPKLPRAIASITLEKAK